MSWSFLFVKIGLVVFVGATLAFSLFTLANFSDNIKRFSFYVRTNDSEMTKRELVSLHYFYDLSQKWRIQWLADKYLFVDAPFYEPAYGYGIRDWQSTIENLKDRQEDSRAHLYGNAKFRQAQTMNTTSPKEALSFALAEVSADFEKALRNCLDSGVAYAQCNDRVWNYDLITNKKTTEEALKGQKAVLKFILGPPRDDKDKIPVPSKDREKKPGDGKEGEESPGTPGPRKRP